MLPPRPVLNVDGPERADLTLPDGTVLVSDIYRPSDGGRHPVLLMRQPYGRSIASTVVLAHPAWYAAQGYVVVVQDVRGCGASGGTFEPFVNEATDGAATVEWARGLRGGDGRLGMYGFSYQAMTQYFALAGGARPDALAPAMGSWNPGMDWLRTGGLLRTGPSVGWAVQMARLVAKRLGDTPALAALAPERGVTAHFDFLVSRPDLSCLGRWAADDASWWSRAAPATRLAGQRLDVPVLHVAGLADVMIGGSLAADAAFRRDAPETTHLVLGPWAHMPWNSSSGQARAGAGAALSVDRAQIAFFDHYLKDIGPKPPALLAYDGKDWLAKPGWPEEPGRQLRLRSGGLAAAHLGDGRLVDVESEGWDRLVHDPHRPAPLIGGAAGLPAGNVDRAALDDRADVATYDSEPFDAPTTLLGPVKLRLAVSADATPFICAATLSEVHPDGCARVLATGVSLAHGEPVEIDLQAMCRAFAPGAVLRLSIQGSADPAFAIPPDQAERFPGAHRPVTLTIQHAGSHLSLPATLQEAHAA
jgi:putative CocE/NonD family hydrolase